MKSIFGQGFNGLSDTLFRGTRGSVFRSVAVDHRSEPGKITVHQKMGKHSGSTIDELCKTSLQLSDGSRLHFSSESGKIWREVSGTYTLVYTHSISKGDIDAATYTDKKLNHSAVVPQGTFRSRPSGGRFFWRNGVNNRLRQYTIDPSELDQWDISLAEENGEFNPTTQTGGDGFGFTWGDSGTKLYIAGASTIYQYTCSTAYDITTASYATISYAISEGSGQVWGIVFNSTGTKMWVKRGANPGSIFQYTLSTAWNVSTASYDSKSFTPSEMSVSDDFMLNAAGTILYMPITSSNTYGHGIAQYTLSTPYDISTATFANKVLSGLKSFDLDEVWSMDFGNSEEYIYFSFGDGQTLRFELPTAIESPIALDAKEYFTSKKPIGSNSAGTQDEENTYSYVYFSTKTRLFNIALADVASWNTRVQPVGKFKNAADFHPMLEQNIQLYIGDGKVMAQVANNGEFLQQTFFNLPDNEVIRSLAHFDTDILVGTKAIGFGRILRWDGLSESWSAQDTVYEKEGVTAFINDDNDVYAVVGGRGEIFFYNGAKLVDFLNIPGITSTNSIKVNPNATGFFRGVPIFGVSNNSGNPVLQGIYGFGAYSSRYPKALSLDYPVSAFSALEIGAILIDGNDLYATYKTGADVGVVRLDWTAKYESAYLETRALSDFQSRHQAKTITEAMATYFLLPANTSITIGHKRAYDNDFTDYTMLTDTERLLVKAKEPGVPKVANPQLRVSFGVSGNNAPVMEDLLYDTGAVGKR